MAQTFTGVRTGATYRVTTNNHRRDIIDACELSTEERAGFDYLDWAAIEDGRDSASFVRYRGELIDLGDIMRAGDDLSAAGWDGFNADTYWSGIAIRYPDPDDHEAGVIVARVMVDD